MNSNNKNDAIQPPLVPTLRQICVSQARMLLRRDFFLLDTLSAELDARNNFRVVADFSNFAALSWSRKNIVANLQQQEKKCVLWKDLQDFRQQRTISGHQKQWPAVYSTSAVFQMVALKVAQVPSTAAHRLSLKQYII